MTFYQHFKSKYLDEFQLKQGDFLNNNIDIESSRIAHFMLKSINLRPMCV